MDKKSSKTLKSGLTTFQKTKSGGRTVTLPVSAADWRAAERVARGHECRDLVTALAGFVADLGATGGRPGHWAANLLSVWLATRQWPDGPEDR